MRLLKFLEREGCLEGGWFLRRARNSTLSPMGPCHPSSDSAGGSCPHRSKAQTEFIRADSGPNPLPPAPTIERAWTVGFAANKMDGWSKDEGLVMPTGHLF